VTLFVIPWMLRVLFGRMVQLMQIITVISLTFFDIRSKEETNRTPPHRYMFHRALCS
jgi:hypothetical protein